MPTDRSDPIQDSFLDRDEHLKILQDTIRTLAKRGNVVIVGRGGQCILKDYPQTLHVRFIAPLEYRIQYTMKWMEREREQATDLVRMKDRQRDYYLRHNYNEDWRDRRLYHLVLNAEKQSSNHLVDLVVQAAQMIE